MPDDTHSHPVREQGYWQSYLQNLYSRMRSMSEQPTQDLGKRAELEREAGLVHQYLGQNADANLVAACECGAALALVRTLHKRSESFEVKLKEEEFTTRLKAEGSFDFAWPHWFDAYVLASVLQHKDALKILSTAECIDACSMPPQYIDRFWPFLCGALVTLANKDPIAPELIDDAAGFMGQATVMDRAYIEGCYLPLIDVMRAILDKDQHWLSTSIEKALQAFHDYFREKGNGDADIVGLYHLPLSALLQQGKSVGLNLEVESNAFLLPTSQSNGVHEIIAVYPTLSIFDALEADWFMSLEGFGQHSNSVLADKEGKLLASYTASNRPGLANAELNFELLDPSDNPFDPQHHQPALDVGQFVHIAQILASEPVTQDDGEPYYRVNEAVTAIDLALRYIRQMGGQVNPATLHSQLGKSLYENEPGRFDPERLLVYRNALAGQAGLPPMDAEASAMPSSEDSAEDKVLALVEEFKPLLLPILQALAVDESGEVIRSLQPLEGDYAKVFEEGAAETAKEYYTEAWQIQNLRIDYDEDTRVDIHMSPAGMLREENALSYHFPNGYRTIAGYLNPHRVWVSWKYYQTGDSAGTAFNGLVWVDDHWAWFPKPYRIGFPTH